VVPDFPNTKMREEVGHRMMCRKENIVLYLTKDFMTERDALSPMQLQQHGPSNASFPGPSSWRGPVCELGSVVCGSRSHLVTYGGHVYSSWSPM
jgi:hypothetical protein